MKSQASNAPSGNSTIVVLVGKTSDVVNDGFIVVAMFPGKILKSDLIVPCPRKRNEKEQFSPH